MKLKIYGLRLTIAAAAPFGLALVPGFGFNNYTFSVLNLALIYCVVAIGLNLLTGYAGLISLGHSGLLAVGAYITAGLSSWAGVPYWLSVGAAGVVCGLLGCLLAIPALRLAGPYLALVTVGFSVAVPQIITFLDFRTDGLEGFKLDKPNLPGFAPDADLARYYLFLPLVLGLFWAAENLSRSRTGRAWQALRDSEKASLACGVSLMRYKVTAFTVSAVYAGIAGGLYAGQIGRITATDFNLLQSILFLVMLAVGGLGNLNGAIIGAVLMTILPELVNRLNDVAQDIFASAGINLQLKNPQYVLYGLLILLFVLFFPKGLVELFNLQRKKTTDKAEIG